MDAGNIINTPQADLSNQGMGSFFGQHNTLDLLGLKTRLEEDRQILTEQQLI
jgi:hypothetical protein